MTNNNQHIDPAKSSKKPRKKHVLVESQIQKQFIKWCRESGDPRLQWVHSTQTAGARTIQARMRAKQEGMLKGVADVSIPYPAGGYHGLYLEFKNPSTTKQHMNKPDQLAFRDYCHQQNYAYFMVTDSDRAIEIVKDYLFCRLTPPSIRPPNK